jgi:shikimate kinase
MVWLIGMMGSGKSTVGRLAAYRVGIPFFDTDAIVEERAGMSISEIWEERGETGFRRMESAVLRDMPDSGVIVAAGGGAVLDPVNRDLMARASKIVWLRCDPAVIAARLRDKVDRPLLARSPERVLDALLDDRTPIYAELATHQIETGTKTLDEVAEEVVGIWQS